MIPPSHDPVYLSSVGEAIFNAMKLVDPKAVWVMQGWLFRNKFWTRRASKALLTSVPQGRMIVLDLFAETYPEYSRLDSFFGQPFVFCMLHNFGGVDGLYGNVEMLVQQIRAARSYPNVTLIGTGLTPEGINQNYVVYDLMLEFGWRKPNLDLNQWASNYSMRRYGNYSQELLGESWRLLLGTILDNHQLYSNSGRYIIVTRPQMNNYHDPIWYDIRKVVLAWDLMIQASQEDDTKLDPISQENKVEDTAELNTRIKSRNEEEMIEENLIMINDKENLKTIGDKFTKKIKQSVLEDSEIAISENMLKELKYDESALRNLQYGVINSTSGVETLEYSENEFHNLIQDNATTMDQCENKLNCLLTFQHDLVDVTRQVLQIYGGYLAENIRIAYRKNMTAILKSNGEELIGVLHDMDRLLLTSKDFLLGAWLQEAAECATSEEERDLYITNALHQISLWGPNGEILDYAVKQWSGVVDLYFRPRWELFIQELLSALDDGESFDQEMFNVDVFHNIEKPFAQNTNHSYPAKPEGNSVDVANEIHHKYRKVFTRRIVRRMQRRSGKSFKKYFMKMETTFGSLQVTHE